jgi:hypothetical protein
MWAGPADGTSARRLDIEVKPGQAGGLQVAITVPQELRPVVLSLLTALGVATGRL